MVVNGNVLIEVVMNKSKFMKNTLTVLIFGLFSSLIFAQVSIGKNEVEGKNTILDFNSTTDNTNGIILPALTKVPIGLDNTENGGTFIFDLSDNKVKMFENGIWVELTDEGSKKGLLINDSEDIGDGIIIGASETKAIGALVLESENSAMILPKVYRPEVNVLGPYPGMICYDTASKSIAIFDGLVWSYWK